MRKFRKRTLFTGLLALGLSAFLATSSIADKKHYDDDDDGDDAPVGAVFVGTNHNNTQDASEPVSQVVMYRPTSRKLPWTTRDLSSSPLTTMAT